MGAQPHVGRAGGSMAGTMGGPGTGLWLLPRGIWLFGPCSRAGREGALLGLAFQPGRDQTPGLFDPQGFKGKALAPREQEQQ